jgi:4-hydroxy-tetrahydrodipicolinate synthase
MAAPRRRFALVILLTVLNSLPGHPGRAPGLRAGEPAASPCPFAGIYPTVVTPFCESGIDVPSLEAQIRYQLHGGVQGLLVLGTIGEGQYVTPEERAQVIATAVRVSCRVPVVVGIHTCDLAVAQEQLLQAKQLGAAAVLVKYLGNPQASPPEVMGFYAALCDLHALPIFYYHYPSQTRLKLSPADIANILSMPGVVGIKESTLNLRETQAHIQLTCGLGKVFLSGTALNLTQFLGVGGQGAMCPEALLLPGPTVQAYTAYTHGRHDEARSLQKELFALTPVLRSSPTPPFVARAMLMCSQDHKMAVPIGHDQPQARLKAALTCLGVCTPTLVKCPLPQLTEKDAQRVDKAVYRIKAIDWCEAALNVAPVPLHTCCEEEEEGLLLKTGSLFLGPGAGKDLFRTFGDGESGF